jgi:hypothetical protein
VGVADHELHAAQPSRHQPLQERPPQRAILAQPHIDTHHLAHPVRPHGVGDHHGHAVHTPALPHMLVASIEPDVRVDGIQPALAEVAALCVQRLGPAADLALGQAGDAKLLHQGFDFADAHALDIGLGDDTGQRLLGTPARLQPAGEGAARAQLRDRQLDRAQPGGIGAGTAVVALGGAVLAARVALRADLGADFSLHQRLQQLRKSPPASSPLRSWSRSAIRSSASGCSFPCIGIGTCMKGSDGRCVKRSLLHHFLGLYLTFGEDRCQLRMGSGPQALAAMCNTVIGVLRRAGHTNIAAARRTYAGKPYRALQLLGLL